MVFMRKSEKHTELVRLIEATRSGDEKAFAELVRRYQDLAYALSCSMLGDPDLAQDAVQESFLTAYYQLHKLRQMEAFPNWLYSIVKHTCHRILRCRRIGKSLDEEIWPEDKTDSRPDHLWEQKKKQQYVLDALGELPQSLRQIMYLFYLEEHTQEEVAGFLGIRKSTVNNRLHAARKLLKRRMFEMAKDTLKSKKLPDDFADNIGKIIRVQGPVLEAQIRSGGTSSLFDSWIPAADTPAQEPPFTIIQREAKGRIRLIATSNQIPIKAGSKIIPGDDKNPMPFSDDTTAEAVASLSPPGDKNPEILKTGIKIIDLMCPLPKRGSVGLFGIQGVGRAIMVMELYHRLIKGDGKLTIFYFVSKEEAVNLRIIIEREPNFPPDAEGPLETAWLVTPRATDPSYPNSIDALTAAVYFSPLMSCRNMYPPVDGIYSKSQLLRSNIVGKDHLEIVQRIRSLLEKYRQFDYDRGFCEYVAIGAYNQARQRYKERSPEETKGLSSEDQKALSRLRKIELFLTQPFYTAESYTNIPGSTVSLADTINGCRKILNGTVDDLPDEAFYMAGSLADIEKRAGR